MTERARLIARAAALSWFHAIDFGDVRTAGRMQPDQTPNLTLFGVMDLLAGIDLSGLDCLDIGAVDGLMAFAMKARGARRAVATDLAKEPRQTFLIAREILGLDVEFRGDTDMEVIADRLGEHAFDVVICAGVMYHMLNPFDALLKARRLLKRDGLLILQSLFDRDQAGATLRFNLTDRVSANLNTFWVPTRAAMEGMMWLGGFELLATRTINSPPFHAVLGRNAQLDELTRAPGAIAAQHARGLRPREFRRELPMAASSVRYTGPKEHRDIDPRTFTAACYPHPDAAKPVIGLAKTPQNV